MQAASSEWRETEDSCEADAISSTRSSHPRYSGGDVWKEDVSTDDENGVKKKKCTRADTHALREGRSQFLRILLKVLSHTNPEIWGESQFLQMFFLSQFLFFYLAGRNDLASRAPLNKTQS